MSSVSFKNFNDVERMHGQNMHETVKSSDRELYRNRKGLRYDPQKRKALDLKEALVVNKLITPDETFFTTDIHIPQDQKVPYDVLNDLIIDSKKVYKGVDKKVSHFNDQWDYFKKTLLNPLVSLTIGLGATIFGMIVFSHSMKKTMAARLANTVRQLEHLKNNNVEAVTTDTSRLIPDMGRNILANDDNAASVLLMFQNPTPKSILAAVGILAISSIGYVAKTFVDGLSDIWVKQKEAVIETNLQEAMIAIETRSFSGKIHIIRSLLANTSKRLMTILQSRGETPTFKGTTVPEENIFKKFQQSDLSVADSFGERDSMEDVSSDKTLQEIDAFLKQNTLPPQSIKHFSQKDLFYGAYILGGLVVGILGLTIVKKQFSKLIADSQEHYAKAKELGQYIQEHFHAQKSGEKLALNPSANSPYILADKAMGGTPGKIAFSSFIEGPTGFLYNFIFNPTPQTSSLFVAITALTGLSYLGAKVLDSIKTVGVKRVNAETERQLQSRLVEVELKNFLAKKNSAIEPLIKDYTKMVKNNAGYEDLHKMYNTILEDIKNGPPFVYS